MAAGLAGKRVAPQVSLGTLVLAAFAADLLWCCFLIFGLEHVQIRQGVHTQDALVAFDIAYSHSLLAGSLWAALLGGAYWLSRREALGAWVIGAAVLSHWLLDFVSHRPDMPLAPGLPQRLGLQLWDSLPATLTVEGGLWLSAVILYARANRAKNRLGAVAFWGGVVVLSLAWVNNIAGPPPPANPVALGRSSLVFFTLVVAWGFWMNRLRAKA
jgi:hypothetical protein